MAEGELAVQALPSIPEGRRAIGLVPVTVSALLAIDRARRRDRF